MDKIPFLGIDREYKEQRELILDTHDKIMSSGKVMNGFYTEQLEKAIARRTNTRHAVAVHSGTNALEISGIAIRKHSLLTRHDPIRPIAIIPALTYPATANAFINAGYRLHFIDVTSYGTLDFSKVPREEYDVLVHVGLYGQPVAYSDLHAEYNRSNGRWHVDDAAQSFGAIEEESAHPIFSIRCLSFDPTKVLANTGNGGMIVTNSDEIATYAKNARSNGSPSSFNQSGTNSRMSETDCATLLIKLNKLDEWLERRRKIALYYISRLHEQFGMRVVYNRASPIIHGAWQKFVLDVDRRDELAEYLKAHLIETKVHYNKALHEMPAISLYDNPGMLSVASALARRVISLPIHPMLTDLEVERVAMVVRGFYDAKGPQAKTIRKTSSTLVAVR